MCTTSTDGAARGEQACQFLVVGAGPAGLTAVATLLDHGVSHIAWVDPAFSAGRIGDKYRDIPSNTKIRLFLEYVAASPTLCKLVNENPERENAYTALQGLDPDQGNLLGYAADLMLMLTHRMAATYSDSIQTFHARVTALDSCADDGAGWTASMEMTDPEHPATKTLNAEKVILATGSEPEQPAESGETIDLEVALSGERLGAALGGMGLRGEEKMGVVGGSHSAFLVLRNLATLAGGPRTIVHVFRRGEVRFAEQKDGWVLFDNTGLKGLVAAWAGEEYWRLVEQRRVERVHAPDPASVHAALQGCVRVIYAIGYRPSATTPVVTLDGRPQTLRFDPLSGAFPPLNRLFGCGIAFPNRAVDPAGNVERAVGIFKFMKFLKSAVPAWILA